MKERTSVNAAHENIGGDMVSANLSIESPIRIKKIYFKNRVVKAPAVCFGWKCIDGIMSEQHLEHYEQYAKAEVGMIILQSILVNRDHQNPDCYAGIYQDGQIGYLSELAARLHKHKAVVFAQLQYADLTKYRPGKDRYSSMEQLEITRIGADFTEAIIRCKKAGLDGVEIHGAHTYILNVLASSAANRRSDCYGGNLEGRLRLVTDIMKLSAGVNNDDFLISYRMGWDVDEQTDILTAQYLESIGIDLLHASVGIPINRVIKKPEGYEFNSSVYFAGILKQHVNCPVIAVNDIRNYKRGSWLIRNGQADFAAYGKPLLADPEMILISRENPEYEPCIKCPRCQWFFDGTNCPVRKKRERL